MRWWGVSAAVALMAATGCGKSNVQVAPSAEALESAKPASATANTFSIDPASSKASWEMVAPIEKIFGEISAGISGDLSIDPKDVTKTTGLLTADIGKIDLFQQKREDEKSDFGEKKHNDKQNEHARQWLEIDPDQKEDARKKNSVAQFSIMKVTTDTPDLTKLTGNERKISGTMTGSLLLHGHKAEKSMKFEATFTFDGDKPKKVVVETKEPMKISLDEFDVKPHDAAGKTLKALDSKVASDAPVMITFTANVK
jgi:polyisoprenoid-binding protein YceI